MIQWKYPSIVVAALVVAALGVPGRLAVAADEAGSSFTFKLTTPPLEVSPEEEGYVAIGLKGFRTQHGRLGAPDVPTRTFLVAIPPDAEPWLDVRVAGESVQRALRPRPLARPTSADNNSDAESDDGADGPLARLPAKLYQPDLAIYDAGETFPAQMAWLGKTGVLRDQRYVEVQLAPVRYDGRTGGLEVASEIEVTVHFGAAAHEGLRPREEPTFESVYRQAFVNYAQGRSFRLSSAGTPFADASSESTSTTTPQRRIRVRLNGLVRLDWSFFNTQAPEFLSYAPNLWRLVSQGAQVPLEIKEVSANSQLDPGEYVQFYGQALDQEPKSVFNGTDGNTSEKLYEARDFTDENIYILSIAGAPQAAMATRDATPGAQPLAGPYFTEVAHQEIDDNFSPFDEFALWYWQPVVTETVSSTKSVALPGLYSTTLPATFRVNIRGASDCFSIEPDHHTSVSVKNATNQTLMLPASDPNNVGNANQGVFEGLYGFAHVFQWTYGGGADPQLSDPLQVTLAAANQPGTCADPAGQLRNDVDLDWIEISYARRFAAASDRLTFTWPDGPATLFEITGFTSSTASVYEITGVLPGTYVAKAVRLTGVQVVPDAGTFKVRFRMDLDSALTDGTPRRFMVTGQGAAAAPVPADFTADRISTLRTDTSQADLVIIAHPSLIPSHCSVGGSACATDSDCTAAGVCQLDPGSVLAQLMAQRASQGISSRLARLRDVEDEFNSGLPGPLAIKNFLSWVVNGGWQSPPPSYVLLIGDGSYDYKGGTGNGNFVPTQIMTKTDTVLGYYASDNLLANVVGSDQLPDLLVGRIPVRTAGDADVVLQKTLSYETVAPAGSWRSNMVFVSDRANDFQNNEALEFEAINGIGISKLAGEPYTYQNLRYWSDYCVLNGGVCDDDLMRTRIKNAVNGLLVPAIDGAVMMQFMGHGNFYLWSSDVLFCANESYAPCNPFPGDETPLLVNGLRMPWLIVHNCLSGAFHAAGPSPGNPKTLGEQWLKRDGGGSVAVFAPTGLGFRFLGEDVTEVTWGTVFGNTKERDLAVPVMNALVQLCTQGSTEGCQFYTLLGDPTTRLQLPHVDPPHNVVAVAGNAVVNLSWLASATVGAKYDVYRAKVDLQDRVYTKINTTPVTGTSFQDGPGPTGPQNAFTYIYYVLARDPVGFHSAWSNFNSDCGPTPGPDCVQASPLNLTPPLTPSGGAAEDPETGGVLSVSWNANPEPDVDYYTLHYGPAPNNLGQTLIVGYPGPQDGQVPPHGITIFGMTNGVAEYFSITATNTSGVSSGTSGIFSGTPTQVLGLESPDLVVDLRLNRAGQNALLSWSPVTKDIYGDPLTTDHYEVFRGTNPQFIPSVANRVGTPAAASFTDVGALANPTAYYYLVRAIDGLGNPGGLGRQLPDGIRQLHMAAAATPGHLVLSWPAVTADFDGLPTQIAYYQLYSSSQPFSREDIEHGLVGLLQNQIVGTSVEIVAPSGNGYYSVLAVDVRGNRSPF